MNWGELAPGGARSRRGGRVFAGLTAAPPTAQALIATLAGPARGTGLLGAVPPLVGPTSPISAPMAVDLGRNDLGPGPLGGITNRSGTFDGGAFGRRDGKALAGCEGEEWIASGMLPGRYSSYDPAAEYWGDVIGFEDGFVYLVFGNCDDFTLLILTDDADFAARKDVETYCQYGIVTRVTGRATEREWECCYDDQVICITMKVRLEVERALARTGELVRVFWGGISLEVYFGNYAHADGDLFHAIHIGRTRAGVRESPGETGGGPGAGLGDVGQPYSRLTYIAVWDCKSCSNAGSSVGSGLNDLLWYLRGDAPGDPLLEGGPYYGGSACDTRHALYLLARAEVWDTCEDWVEELCDATPMQDCATPSGIDSPADKPGAGSTAGA